MKLSELPQSYRASAAFAQRSITDYNSERPKTRKLVLWAFFDLIWYVEREHYVMASKSRETTFGDFRFCSVTLTPEDKSGYETWAAKHGADLLTVLAQCSMEGWKTSVTWDSENECFIGSLTCRSEGHKNENVVVVSRSDDLLEALALSLYKITDMYKGKKLPTDKIKNNWG